MRGVRLLGVARPVALAALLAFGTGATLAGCSTGDGGAAAGAAIRVTVSVTGCGTGWADPRAGAQHFVLADTDSRAGDVQLTDATTGAVYADVEPIGPGTHTSLYVDLGAGRYAFRCAMEDEAMITGPTVRIAGHATGSTPAVRAVTQADLVGATKAYEQYVTGQLPTLATLVARLQADVDADRLTTARTDWLPAHLEYERLGAAYDAFGPLDAAINGLPDGLPGGVQDPNWSGFHRIEYGLWHGQSAAELRGPVAALASAVDRLQAHFADTEIDPLQLSIRAHEITENALEFELTGRTDFGSHTELATVGANLDGTATLLGIIHTLLAPRDPQTAAITTALDQARTYVAGLQSADGDWPALTALTRVQREQLDARIDTLVDLLAPVAAILEPRLGP